MRLMFLSAQRIANGFFELMKMDGMQIGSILCFIMYFLIAAFAQDCRDARVQSREAAEWQAQKDQIWFDKERICGETCKSTYSYRDGTCFCIALPTAELESIGYSLP